MMKKTITSLALFLSLSLSTTLASAQELSGPAPDFTLKSKSGENIKLSEQIGEVVMINFWASWCAPCRQEMPLLDALYQEYQDLGFELLGVNIDEDPEMVDRILQKIPVTFPILLDTQNEIAKLYKVSAMPTTILIDRDGKLRYLHKGYKPGYEDDYEKQIKELVME